MKYAGALLCLFFFLQAQAQSRVVAQISRFRNDKGVCRACLFNNAAAFEGKGAPVQCVEVAIKNKEARAEFTGVAAGTYAVLVFHDANNNKKFDTNFLGIPSEGYGASRNNLPFAAAPGYNGNKFDLPDRFVITLPIRLRNL